MSTQPDAADEERINADLARFRERVEEAVSVDDPVTTSHRSPFSGRGERRKLMLLWIIVLLLVIFAIGGGVAVSNLLWLLLVVALIVAVVGLVSGRRAI